MHQNKAPAELKAQKSTQFVGRRRRFYFEISAPAYQINSSNHLSLFKGSLSKLLKFRSDWQLIVNSCIMKIVEDR